MLIGLLSDTHIPNHVAALPAQLKEAFRGVELILHAGDIYNIATLDELEGIAPIIAAEGDDDPYRTASDKRVKSKHFLTVEGVTIWLAHSWWDFWPFRSRQELRRLSPQQDSVPDVLVFGHSHEAKLEKREDLLLVNPGSPTFPYYKHELGTVGLLTIDSGKAEAQIIQLR